MLEWVWSWNPRRRIITIKVCRIEYPIDLQLRSEDDCRKQGKTLWTGTGCVDRVLTTAGGRGFEMADLPK